MTITDVNKNSFILLYGTFISQALPLAFSPVLARLYTPAEFGAFSLYYGVSAIFGNIAAGKFDMALYTAKSSINATITAFSGFIFAIMITALLLAILLGTFAFADFGRLTLGLVICIPFTVFALGTNQILVAFGNRAKRFRDISRAKIILGSTWVSVNLVGGLAGWSAFGLALGYCLGQVFSLVYLYYKNRADFIGVPFSPKTFKFNILRNKNYVFIFLPAHFINIASANAPALFMSYFFGLSTNGYFFKAARVGESPTGIVKNSIGNVFWQKASEEFISHGNTRHTMMQFLVKLLVLAVPSYLILYIFAEDIFVLVFGEQWINAAHYYKLLTPYYFLQFIITPISVMVILANKPWVDITWQLLYATCIAVSFIYGWYVGDILAAIKTYSLLMSLMLLTSFGINYYYSIRR